MRRGKALTSPLRPVVRLESAVGVGAPVVLDAGRDPALVSLAWALVHAAPGGPGAALTPIYRLWAGLTLGTMAISLAFDFVDVARYPAGDP